MNARCGSDVYPAFEVDGLLRNLFLLGQYSKSLGEYKFFLHFLK